MLRRSLAALTAAVLAFAWLATPAHADGGTTYTWIGASQDPAADNHSWTDPRNWSPGGVPGDGDSVVIHQPDPAHCTAAVDNVPTVALVSFTLEQVPDLCGSAVHDGAITVSDAFTWDGGVLDTPLTLEPGSTGTVSGSNGTRNAVWQDVDVAGTLELADLHDTGGLFFANYGALAITVENGGVLRSTGTTELSALSCCGAPGSIVNNGTLDVASGRVHAHSVRIAQNGAVSAAAGATLDSDGGVVEATGGAHYTGAGTWTVENGAHARFLGGQTLGAAFHLQLGTIGAGSGATLGGRFSLHGAGTFDWSAGTLGGAVTVAHGTHVHLSGVTTGNGRRTFAAGDPSGTAAGPSRLVNHGDVVVDDSAAVSMAGATTLTNAADGTLELAPGTVVNSSSCCVSPAVLANAGHVVVGSAALTTPVTLPLVAYRDTGGTTTVAAGQQLQLSHGPAASLSGSRLQGGGTVQVGGATAVSGDIALTGGTTLALVAGGSLDGTATVDGGGAVRWTGGSMSGSLTLGPHGGTHLSGTAVKSVAPAPGNTPSQVTMDTAMTFAPGTSAAHDVLDLGASTLVLNAATSMTAYAEIRAGAFTNAGQLSMTSGTGSSRVTVGHAATVGGTVRVVNKNGYHPADGTVLTLLTSAALTWTGTVSSAGAGVATGHWAAAPTATALAVQWVANA